MSPAYSAATILAAMPAAARELLASIAIAETSASTQADALAATTPAQGGALYLAEAQTAGQGRMGRAWLSVPADGSLAMSLARRFRNPLAAMSGLSLVAGIAVAEALAVESVGLKWPNDLVADGRKLGGILVNLRAAPDGACDAVVGIGLNLRLPDHAGIDQPWTDLARLGRPVADRNALVASLLQHLLPAFAQFEAQGVSAFIERWHRLDALSGRAVRILDGTRVHEGVAAGISADGALRLRDGAVERLFSGGEVSLRPA
jgi:BirA family biotin operon repressor/biotin-[acetyl-CoA-carboxylase] ligase